MNWSNWQSQLRKQNCSHSCLLGGLIDYYGNRPLIPSDRDVLDLFACQGEHLGGAGAIWVHADAHEATKLGALGTFRAATNDAGKSAVLVARGGILKDAGW